ncbi:hypothetical protein ACJBSJ_10785, partial [Streptococcus suis]
AQFSRAKSAHLLVKLLSYYLPDYYVKLFMSVLSFWVTKAHFMFLYGVEKSYFALLSSVIQNW